MSQGCFLALRTRTTGKMSRRKLRPRSDPGGRRGVGSSWEKGLHLEKEENKNAISPFHPNVFYV